MVASRTTLVFLCCVALVAAVVGAGGVTATEQNSRPTTDVEVLKAKVARATRMLAREGIIASSGHVSARVPGTDRVVIGPADVTRDILTAADIVTVDLNSKKISGNGGSRSRPRSIPASTARGLT